MNASDKDSPARLKTGFDPITPFSRKRKKKQEKKNCTCFRSAVCTLWPQKGQSRRNVQKLEGHNSNRLSILIFLFSILPTEAVEGMTIWLGDKQ